MNSLTYLYCVVSSARPPRMNGVPRGLPGLGAPRAVPLARSLFAIVADAPRSRYAEAAVNRGLADLDWVSRAAVAHEAVVEHFIDEHALLPAKLFTIFDDDARLLAHLQAERSRLSAVARRVAGQLEWGVRMSIDASAVAGEAASARVPRGTTLSGAGYLQLKQARRNARDELALRAKKIAADVYRRLARKARAARRRAADRTQPAEGTLLLDAAFLVPRSRTKTFRALAAAQAKALASRGYVVTMTGPWPPYSFVQD